jgi:PAS domain S-box-containing protein
MKTRTLLKLMGLFAIGLSLLIGLVLFRTVMATEQANAERRSVQGIILSVFDLNLLTHEYILHPGERAAVQWRVKYDEILESLRGYPGRDDQEQPFESMRSTFLEIGTVFERLSRTFQDSPPPSPAGLTELQNALVGRLLINQQTVKTTAASIFHAKDARVEQIRRLTNNLVMASVLAAALLITLGTVLLDRFLSRPTMALFEGTKRIAAGDLSHRVEPVGFTEHRELAHSFNAMSERLQLSYARLEDEIGERMKAQQDLSRTLGELEQRVRDRTLELESANTSLQHEMELRTQWEEELRMERNRLFVLLNSLPAYIFLMDQEFRISFANGLFVERFGEPGGRHCYEIIKCREGPCPDCEVKRVFDTGQEQTREFVALDGTHYQVFDYPFFDPDGTPLVLELGIDITARKQAEQALQRRELEYRALVENAPDLISRFDREHRYVYINPVIERLSGHPPSLFLGRTVSEAGFSAELSRLFDEMIDLVFSTGEIQVFEHEYPTGSEVKHLSMILAPEFSPEGGVSSVLTITRDVTALKRLEQALRRSHEELESRVQERTAELAEAVGALEKEVDVRRKTEQALRESEQQYRALVENAPDVIARIDRNHRVLYANPAVERLGNRPREWYIGRTIHEITAPRDLNGLFLELLGKVFDSGREQAVETEYLFPDGKKGYFLTRLTPELSKEGQVETILAISHDITPLKELEKMLREANQAKSEFLANMSHELRTPISGILGITEIDLTRELPPEIREDLEMIHSSASSLINIINDLLDLSRIEARKLQLYPADFDPRATVREVVRSYEQQASRKGLSLTLEIGDEVPQALHGDADRLTQVLRNLIGNGVKFTERGGVDVLVRALVQDQGTMLRFTISDTGIGIPPDRQKELFQSFGQLEPALTKKHGGAGLGLVISRQIVEMMGGSIRVSSSPGKGSIFSFTALFGDPVGERRAMLRKKGAEILSELSPLRILLAEDNKVNRLFLTRFLSNAGHRVVSVENGREVLDILPKKRFDLILMDIQMPELDGLEATRRIRSASGRKFDPKIPIIALTAYAMKGDKERFLEAGMNDYVTKPIDFNVLGRSIAEVVSMNPHGHG